MSDTINEQQADSIDQLLTAESPEYYMTLNRHGRQLTPARVERILADHSFTVSDLLSDTSFNITNNADTLPDHLDAALLYAWLGY